MEPIAIVRMGLLLIVALFWLLGIYSEQITAVVRRRSPDFWLEGDVLMIWGLVLVAAFALGLVVMYLILRP